MDVGTCVSELRARRRLPSALTKLRRMFGVRLGPSPDQRKQSI